MWQCTSDTWPNVTEHTNTGPHLWKFPPWRFICRRLMWLAFQSQVQGSLMYLFLQQGYHLLWLVQWPSLTLTQLLANIFPQTCYLCMSGIQSTFINQLHIHISITVYCIDFSVQLSEGNFFKKTTSSGSNSSLTLPDRVTAEFKWHC